VYHELRNNVKTKSGALRNSVVIVWRYTHGSTRAAHQCSYSLVFQFESKVREEWSCTSIPNTSYSSNVLSTSTTNG